MHLVASVCQFVRAPLFEPFDIDVRYEGRHWPYVKVVGQRSRSNAKNRVLISLLVGLSCCEVKIKGRGQGHGSR